MLSDLSCIGNESSITECGHRSSGVHNCSHSEDVGVLCEGQPVGGCGGRRWVRVRGCGGGRMCLQYYVIIFSSPSPFTYVRLFFHVHISTGV